MTEKKVLKLEISGSLPAGECVLTGKQNVEVYHVTTEDGFLSDAPVCLKGIAQLVKMKLNGHTKKLPEAEAA